MSASQESADGVQGTAGLPVRAEWGAVITLHPRWGHRAFGQKLKNTMLPIFGPIFIKKKVQANLMDTGISHMAKIGFPHLGYGGVWGYRGGMGVMGV